MLGPLHGMNRNKRLCLNENKHFIKYNCDQKLNWFVAATGTFIQPQAAAVSHERACSSVLREGTCSSRPDGFILTSETVISYLYEFSSLHYPTCSLKQADSAEHKVSKFLIVHAQRSFLESLLWKKLSFATNKAASTC